MSKQKETPVETIEINGRLATTVSGATKLLSQRAKEELGIDRNYSRDAVYAMFTAGKIEGIRTPSANYYFLDTLKTVHLDPYRRKRKTRQPPKVGKEGYPQSVKEEALRLYGEGILSKRAIARRLEISYQTVNNWIKESQESNVSEDAA